MKILHISYSSNKGGASRAAIRIHESLIKKKINSDFKISITNKNEEPKIKNIIRPNSIINIINILKSLLEKIMARILRSESFVKNSISLFPSYFHKIINKSNYDIIHLHWINGETMSIEDIGKITKPIVWTCQDMWPFLGSEHYKIDNFENKKNKLFWNISKFTLKRKIKAWRQKLYIVTVSEWLARYAKKSVLMKNKPIMVIPNTLDTTFWKPLNKIRSKKKFNLPINKKIIGFCSLGKNNNFLKGKDLFLNAIENIINKNKKLAIFSIGESNNFSFKNKRIDIFHHGKINDDFKLRTFYNSLDMLVVPSRLEAFGQVASEAIACGIPVVCFNSTGLKDIIVHKKNGFLAKAFDIKDLEKGIKYILSLKKEKYFKMKNRCIKIAKKKFSMNIVSEQYIDLYKKILIADKK